MASLQWYLLRDGQARGPFSDAELRRLTHSGRLQPTDLLWRDGLPKWTEAREIDGLIPEPKPGLGLMWASLLSALVAVAGPTLYGIMLQWDGWQRGRLDEMIVPAVLGVLGVMVVTPVAWFASIVCGFLVVGRRPIVWSWQLPILLAPLVLFLAIAGMVGG